MFALAGDETKSTVSDTWSTDVLASDSEPPEQNQLERLEEIAEEMVRHNLLGVQEVLSLKTHSCSFKMVDPGVVRCRFLFRIVNRKSRKFYRNRICH